MELLRDDETLTENDIDVENYHVYQDDTGFDYDIVLTRVDITNNANERYNICVSHNTLQLSSHYLIS